MPTKIYRSRYIGDENRTAVVKVYHGSDLVRKAAKRKRGRLELACRRAFRLARKHGLSVREIGRICDCEKIHIVHCQLGCFRQDRVGDELKWRRKKP